MVCRHGNRKKTQPLGTYSMPCILFQQNMNGAEIILEEMIKKTVEEVRTGLMNVTRAAITELFLTGGLLS